jgi:hypothetical protein
MSLKDAGSRSINQVIPLPPNQEPSLATYAGNQTAAYKQQSILTAPPGRLYAFCRRHLMEATAEQDPSKIEEVSELLGELREAWAEIAGS